MKAKRTPWFFVVCGTVVALLCSMIVFPLGHDQAIFEVGGRMIVKKSAIPYRDFLDMKQPLIFYIYGASNWLFGDHEWSIRVLDIIYHILTLSIFYRILRKGFQNQLIAGLSVLIYTLFYVGSGFWMTAQTESFALLPSLVLLYCIFTQGESTHSIQKTLGLSIAASVSIFLLMSLKFTLGIILIPAAFFPLVNGRSDRKNSFIFVIMMIAVLIVLTGISFLWMQSVGAWENFVSVTSWVMKYAAIYPLLSIDTFTNVYFHEFPANLVTSLSFTYFILCVSGIVLALKGLFNAQSGNSFVHLLLWMMLFSLFGVLVERKNFVYHYTRAVWTMAPFIALSLVAIALYFRTLIKTKIPHSSRSRFFRISSATTILFLGLLFSPLPRIISQSSAWGKRPLLDTQSQTVSNRTLAEGYADDKTYDAFASLKAKLKSGEEVFFWGNYVHFYIQTGTLPPTLCLANPQLISPWTPMAWKQQMLKELVKAHPRFFVSEDDDARPTISGTSQGSYKSLLAWPELRNYLFSNYVPIDSLKHFRIFSRIGS